MSASKEINIDEEEEEEEEEEEVRFHDDQNVGYDEESVYAEIAAYEETSKVQSDLLYISQHAIVDVPWASPQPNLPKVDRPASYASLLASHNLMEIDDSDDDSDDEDTEDEAGDGDIKEGTEVAGGKQTRTEKTTKILQNAAMAIPWLTEDEDGSALSSTGPPRTKNEMEEDLLVVEDLSDIVITLNADRLELIGEVLYTLESEQTVIVQATYTNNPLNDGSVLCNRDGELLGKIYEVFGPITTPFYTIKIDHRKADIKIFYNKFQSKTAIYCVWRLSTFVTPALLMQRGTDASNMYDEEILDEQEFSDDEKELEAKQAKNKAAKQKKQPLTTKTNHIYSSSMTRQIPQPPTLNVPTLTIPNNMTNNNVHYQQTLPWAGFQQPPPSAPQLNIQPEQQQQQQFTSDPNYRFP